MRMRAALSLGLVGSVLAVSRPADAAPYAKRIDAANARTVRLRGSDAIAGLNDWALGDGILCAAISDVDHESDFSTTGGGLIDLGRCGRQDDQFVIYDQLRNLSLSKSVPISSIAAHEGPGWARIDTHGESDGAVLETVYSLDTKHPGHLRISAQLTRRGDGEALFGLGGALANAYTLRPFVTSIASRGRSRGFVGPAFLGQGPGAIAAAAVADDTVVLVGEGSLEPGVSYGFRVLKAERIGRDGDRVPLPVFVLADDLATLFAVFSRPFWIGGDTSLGWAQLLQTKLMNLGAGEAIAYELDVVVGERADVASALDQLVDGGQLVRGHLDDEDGRVAIDSADGAPATEVRPLRGGAFEAKLPPGKFVLRATAPGARRLEKPFEVASATVDLGTIAVGAPARIELPRGHAMRLVFVGEDGTPDPKFGDDLLGFDVIGKEVERTAVTRDVALSGSASDPDAVTVAPGHYRVYATRGLEYGVTESKLEAKAGQTTALEIAPPSRAFETPGWISADFHVHGSRSLDSALSDAARLRAYVAEGAEVLVATDHDAVTDYGPRIHELGLDGQVATVIGTEATSETKTKSMPHTIGHANAFPYRGEPLAYRDGVPPNEGRRWRDVVPALRALPGERVVQLNHARYPGLAYHPRGFFTHLGFVGKPYDPTQPIDAWPNRVLIDPDPATGARDIDFDAMEILNGKRMEAYDDLCADWYSLLRQALVLTGTANSDSHNLEQIVAAPRNYVAVTGDEIATFKEAELVAAVRHQRVLGTTGPFVEVSLGGKGMGDRFVGEAGTLAVKVKAAPWVLLRQLRVLVNGFEVARQPIGGPGEWNVPVTFSEDGFVTAEIQGEAGPTYAAVLPGFLPIAFTNPIFVDADGDGEWHPRWHPSRAGEAK